MKKISITLIGIVVISLLFIIIGCGTSNINTTPAQTSPTVVQSPQSSPVLTSVTKLDKVITLGPLSTGLKSSDIINILGQPEEKSAKEFWKTNGQNAQKWIYNSKGVTLTMLGDVDQKVYDISIKDPCVYKTTENLGINSTVDQINKVYKNNELYDLLLDNTYSTMTATPKDLTSKINNIRFHIVNNKVCDIYLSYTED